MSQRVDDSIEISKSGERTDFNQISDGGGYLLPGSMPSMADGVARMERGRRKSDLDGNASTSGCSPPQWRRDGILTATSIPRSPSYKAALNDPQLSKSLQDATPKRSYDDPNSPSSISKMKFQKAVRR